MILQQYIHEVLFKQRVCVVPHLGTFSVQHFPAHYNTNTQTLTPPREQVMFTQQWQDDGSCLEWIALKENLVPAVAQRKLEKYLEELKASLQSGIPLVLPGIGQLQGDFAGNIHFHAEELPVSRDVLDIAPLLRPDSKPTPPPTPAPAPPVSVAEPIMTPEVEETLEALTEESGFKWWWAAIPAAAIIIGIAVWWYVSGISPAVSSSAPSTNADTVTTRQPVAPAVDSAQQAIADSVANASKEITYYAVIDKYKDSSNAVSNQKRQRTWRKLELVIYKKDGMFKLALPLHSVAADTTQQLNKVRETFNRAYLEFP